MATLTIDSPLTRDEIARRLDAIFDRSGAADPVWTRIVPSGVAYAGRRDEKEFMIRNLRVSYGPSVLLRGTFSEAGAGVRVKMTVVRGRARLIATVAILGLFVPAIIMVLIVGMRANIATAEIVSVVTPLAILAGAGFALTRMLADPKQDMEYVRTLLTISEEAAEAEAHRAMVLDLAETGPHRARTEIGSFTVATPLPAGEVLRRLRILIGGNPLYSDVRTVRKPQYAGVISADGFRMRRVNMLERGILDGTIARSGEGTALTVSFRIDRWSRANLGRAFFISFMIGLVAAGLNHPFWMLACILALSAIDIAIMPYTLRRRMSLEKLFLEKVMKAEEVPTQAAPGRAVTAGQ